MGPILTMRFAQAFSGGTARVSYDVVPPVLLARSPDGSFRATSIRTIARRCRSANSGTLLRNQHPGDVMTGRILSAAVVVLAAATADAQYHGPDVYHGRGYCPDHVYHPFFESLPRYEYAPCPGHLPPDAGCGSIPGRPMSGCPCERSGDSAVPICPYETTDEFVGPFDGHSIPPLTVPLPESPRPVMVPENAPESNVPNAIPRPAVPQPTRGDDSAPPTLSVPPNRPVLYERQPMVAPDR